MTYTLDPTTQTITCHDQGLSVTWSPEAHQVIAAELTLNHITVPIRVTPPDTEARESEHQHYAETQAAWATTTASIESWMPPSHASTAPRFRAG
jgi:hypothetical protein